MKHFSILEVGLHFDLSQKTEKHYYCHNIKGETAASSLKAWRQNFASLIMHGVMAILMPESDKKINKYEDLHFNKTYPCKCKFLQFYSSTQS